MRKLQNTTAVVCNCVTSTTFSAPRCMCRIGGFWVGLHTWSRLDRPNHCHKKDFSSKQALCRSFSTVFMVKLDKIYSKWIQFPTITCHKLFCGHTHASVNITTTWEINNKFSLLWKRIPHATLGPVSSWSRRWEEKIKSKSNMSQANWVSVHANLKAHLLTFLIVLVWRLVSSPLTGS